MKGPGQIRSGDPEQLPQPRRPHGRVAEEIGRFRRRHLTPMPHVGSLAALNEALAAADARDDARRIPGRTETVGQVP